MHVNGATWSHLAATQEKYNPFLPCMFLKLAPSLLLKLLIVYCENNFLSFHKRMRAEAETVQKIELSCLYMY